MDTLAHLVDRADRLAHLHFMGFTCLWPVLGLLSTDAPFSASLAGAVVLVGICFHLFGFLLNDVVDLPIDRTQPLRRGDPLVDGTVSVPAALALALAQIPIAFGVLWQVGAGRTAYAALAAAFACMAVYDLVGKRSPNPILTDLVLGVSGSSLVVVGASVAGTGVSAVAVVVAAYVAAYFVLFNGIHGGMRDMANDAACGARTTGLFLGMRVSAGIIVVSTRAAVFCWALQVILILLAAALVFAAGYDGATTSGVLALSAALAAINAGLMRVVLTPTHPRWEEAYRLHLVTLVLAPIVILWPMMGTAVTLTVLAVFLVPMGLVERAPSVVRWMMPGLHADL